MVKGLHMACFTLSAAGRQLLAGCISIGYEDGEQDISSGDCHAIEALMDELISGAGPIEITVMPIEDEGEDSEIDMDGNRVGYEELTGGSGD